MIGALRKTGWLNYSLFRRPDGLLVGYIEAANFETRMRANGWTRRQTNEKAGLVLP
jgi:hypothetical protein